MTLACLSAVHNWLITLQEEPHSVSRVSLQRSASSFTVSILPAYFLIWSALKVQTRWLLHFPQILFSSYIFSTGKQMALCRQAMWSMVGNVGRHVTCVCFRKTVSFIPEDLTRQVFIKWHVDYICEWKCNIYYCDCMFSLIHPVFGMKATWFSLCFTQGTWKGCLCLKDDSVKTLTIL